MHKCILFIYQFLGHNYTHILHDDSEFDSMILEAKHYVARFTNTKVWRFCIEFDFRPSGTMN